MTCHYCGEKLNFTTGMIEPSRDTVFAYDIVRCRDFEACRKRMAEKKRELS